MSGKLTERVGTRKGEYMSLLRAMIGIIFGVSLGACGPPSLLQPQVMKDVDTHFDFHAWRATPAQYKGRKVQLGGRIVQADLVDNGVLIVGQQLPIREQPVYGPTEIGRKPGAFEFAFLYPGKIEPSALTEGNRFIVIGTTDNPKMVTVDGAPKTEPYLVARCVHIWKAEGREIADFPEIGGSYYPLEENTYCAQGN
jgi:starvation-inducible outer membrane lipoprotein